MPATFSDSDRSAIRQRFLSVDTSVVADVLDTVGLPDQGLSLEFSPYRRVPVRWRAGPTRYGDRWLRSR